MPLSSELLDFLKEQMAEFGGVSVRRMFSGAGLFRDGLMFALVADDTLYFKADAVNAADFEALGLDPFSYATKNGRNTIMSYRRAPAEVMDDPSVMTSWCETAFAAALRAAQASKQHRSPGRKSRPKKRPA